MTTPTVLLEIASDTAAAAGELLLDYASQRAAGADLGIGAKSTPTDLVSEADLAAERLISDRLHAARPDDGFVAEEDQADRLGSSGLRWVVDPLDGTVNFLYGVPQWAVSIACEDAHGAVAAVVHDPIRGETFCAARGLGAHLDDVELAVSDAGSLADSLVATGFTYDVTSRTDWARDVAALLPVVRDVRRAGSAALDLAWCAAGRYDAYVEFGLSQWDWSAGGLLVREAGGAVSEAFRRLGGRDVRGLVAGGRRAHDELAAWVAALPPHGTGEESDG